MKAKIVHVAAISLNEQTGMGRIACRWRDAFVARGYEFVHVGPAEVGSLPHPTLWGGRAAAVVRAISGPKVILAHEPGSGALRSSGTPLIVFSHGIERRHHDLNLSLRTRTPVQRMRSILSAPLWRWSQHLTDRGLRSADLVLVSNREDLDYCLTHYDRNVTNTQVFRNGVVTGRPTAAPATGPTKVLFIGTWIPRKGIKDLIQVIPKMSHRFPEVRWCLAGTGSGRDEILGQFPAECRKHIEVIPKFDATVEEQLHLSSTIFLFPTYAEGQSLALLQAMEAGLCCITTDNCGQRDVIQHGVNGLLCNAADTAQLVALLTECLGSPGKCRSLGEAARKSVADRTWSATADEVVFAVEGLSARIQ